MASYVPTVWTDDDGTNQVGTVFTAARMNHIEQGIVAAGSPDAKITLDWNLATQPGFYRAIEPADPGYAGRTLHGPDPDLNPLPAIGLVLAQPFALVQLAFVPALQQSYTRYRGSDNVWSAWVPDLRAPQLLTDASGGFGSIPDGTERVFQTAAMNALGIMWRFRYNAASGSPYKWEFIGGPPLSAEANASSSTTVTGFSDLPDGLGPSFALPLIGDYLLSYGALVQPAGVGQGAGISPVANGLAAQTALGAWTNNPNTATGGQVGVARQHRADAISGTLKLQAWCGLVGALFLGRHLSATPIRVSM